MGGHVFRQTTAEPSTACWRFRCVHGAGLGVVCRVQLAHPWCLQLWRLACATVYLIDPVTGKGPQGSCTLHCSEAMSPHPGLVFSCE